MTQNLYLLTFIRTIRVKKKVEKPTLHMPQADRHKISMTLWVLPNGRSSELNNPKFCFDQTKKNKIQKTTLRVTPQKKASLTPL